MAQSSPSRAQLACWADELREQLSLAAQLDSCELISAIVDLSDTMGTATAEALLDTRKDLFEHKTFLTERYRDYIVRMEGAEAERLQRIEPRVPASFTEVTGAEGQAAYDRVQDLFNRVDFERCRRFVLVGCGQLPVTIFHVHDKTDVAELVALDVRPEAVETVNNLAARLVMPRVTAELGDALDHDFSSSQVIYVANMVSPKGAALSHIADTAPEDVQIVVREPYALGRLWAESGERELDPRLEVIARGPGSRYLSRDVFLRRR